MECDVVSGSEDPVESSDGSFRPIHNAWIYELAIHLPKLKSAYLHEDLLGWMDSDISYVHKEWPNPQPSIVQAFSRRNIRLRIRTRRIQRN